MARWKKGQSGNPKGSKKRKTCFAALEEAIKSVEKTKDKTLMEHFVEQAYTDNHVLVALMKKVVADLKGVELSADVGVRVPFDGDARARRALEAMLAELDAEDARAIGGPVATQSRNKRTL